MVAENKIPEGKIFCYHNPDYSLSFYARSDVPTIGLNEVAGLKKGSWVFTDQLGYNDLKKKEIKFKVLKTFPSYRVTLLKLSFLYRKTRERQLKNDYLLEII